MVRLYNEYYAPHPEFKDVIAQVDAHITQALQILEDTCIDPIDAEHYIIGSVTRLSAQRWLKREIERRRYLHKLEREIAEMDKPKPVEELEDGAPGTSGYNSFSGRS